MPMFLLADLSRTRLAVQSLLQHAILGPHTMTITYAQFSEGDAIIMVYFATAGLPNRQGLHYKDA
jgi:hypothetical protein